jgi:hypothetical protein
MAMVDGAVTGVWGWCAWRVCGGTSSWSWRLLAGDADRGFSAGMPLVYCFHTWSTCGQKVVWGLPILVSNKGGCPRVPTRSKMKSLQMDVTIDLTEVFCFGMLRWRTPIDDSCLEMARLGGIQSCAPIFFLWPFGFRGSAPKLCWLLISWGMFSFHGAGGECHGSRDLMTSDGGLSLVGDDELAWWFVTWSISMPVRAAARAKFKSYLSGWKSKVWS